MNERQRMAQETTRNELMKKSWFFNFFIAIRVISDDHSSQMSCNIDAGDVCKWRKLHCMNIGDALKPVQQRTLSRNINH